MTRSVLTLLAWWGATTACVYALGNALAEADWLLATALAVMVCVALFVLAPNLSTPSPPTESLDQ